MRPKGMIRGGFPRYFNLRCVCRRPWNTHVDLNQGPELQERARIGPQLHYPVSILVILAVFSFSYPTALAGWSVVLSFSLLPSPFSLDYDRRHRRDALFLTTDTPEDGR